MNRKFFEQDWFEANEINNNLQCPICGKGHLSFDPNKILKKETECSKNINGDKFDRWFNEKLIFSGMLECSNLDCEDSVVFAGKIVHQPKFFYCKDTEQDEEVIIDVFKPEYFSSSIKLFEIPKDCPENINKAIIDSFKLFWIDCSSCANKIRLIVEVIMDNYKIYKMELSKEGKRVPRSLHNRIDDFKKINELVANKLFAIKWIGNEGSHRGKTVKSDLLDAYEILENVINDLYSQKTKKQLQNKIKKIIKRKKPLSKK